MTVAEQVAHLKDRLRDLTDTPCERCGHSYGRHKFQQHCTGFARFENMRGVYCQCRRFVDPEEVLA